MATATTAAIDDEEEGRRRKSAEELSRDVKPVSSLRKPNVNKPSFLASRNMYTETAQLASE